METSKMKNMVVLKNLPSNLVEEAIVILKSSKKVKKLEKIEKNNKINQEEVVKKEKDYILKEAIKNSKKYMRLKRYAYICSIALIIQTFFLIIK